MSEIYYDTVISDLFIGVGRKRISSYDFVRLYSAHVFPFLEWNGAGVRGKEKFVYPFKYHFKLS